MPPWMRSRWVALRASYWFLPALLALAAMALAWLMLRVDAWVLREGLPLPPLVYPGGAEGARSVLSTIAASMIGIAGVSFSVTIVALSLASSQLGPRLLRSFMRDRGNQVVLGTFIATFLYDLLVLGTVQDGFVPRVAITLGLALGVASVGVLVYFFHHVATSIQADHVVAAVARDLLANLERLAGAPRDEAEPGDDAQALPDDAAEVRALREGYLGSVDHAALVAKAQAHDLVIELPFRAGDFVVANAVVARAAPAERVPEDLAAAVHGALLVGAQRTEEQDLEFAVRQLVEVALRALSPGVRDPFTAMACLDWLGAALVRVGQRGLPPGVRRDAEGRVRLRVDAPDLAGVVDAALQQIRQAAADDLAVVLRLLETIAAAAPHLPPGPGREALRFQAGAAAHGLARDLPDGADRRALDRRLERALGALAGPRVPPPD